MQPGSLVVRKLSDEAQEWLDRAAANGPLDHAQAATAFICSDGASQMTGAVLLVDGGLSILQCHEGN